MYKLKIKKKIKIKVADDTIKKMDKVFIEITNCNACPYTDHSGSFTPGGAKHLCGHSDASDKATENKEINFLVEDAMGDKIKAEKHHWIHRVIKDNKIPTWCPLR